MASYNSTDADIESIYSEEGSNSFKRHSFSSDKPVFRFLIFDCDSTSSFLVAGKIVNIPVNPSVNLELVQRDIILKYGRPFSNVLNNDQYAEIFGTNHKVFLSPIQSIFVFLPNERTKQLTFFISKTFANTPIHISNNAMLLESPVPFFCVSLPRPITLDNIQFIKQQLSEELLQLCYDNENAETTLKVEILNQLPRNAFYFDVVKIKTNIVKFSYHQSFQSSLVLHIEQLSTDTIEEFLKAYLKRAAKEVEEFRGKDIADFSVTDDIGKRVDYNLKAIICLLFDEKQIMKDINFDHSYPTFIVHFTPKLCSYIQLGVRIIGEDRGHMHPFTVFVRSDCSTFELRHDISKHCHWNPKSFEVFLPSSPNVIDEVDNIQNLPKLISSNSVLTVRRTKKIVLTIKSGLPDMDSFTLQEHPMCSVEELKNKVSKRCDILPKQFDLMYKSKVLEETIILEDIIEKKANLEMLFNENRIIFRLYLLKTLPNRTNTEFHEHFIHVKVDNPDDQIGEITSLFAEKLKMEEGELHLLHKGFCVEKHKSYKDADVIDGSVLCLCHCENPAKGPGSQTMETIFQATTTGSVEKVTEPSMVALQMKLRKLELQQSKKEPKFKIISRDVHNRKIFNRMVSVPPNTSRSSHAVDVLDGYKSDTDLLRQKQAANSSSSESQLEAHYNFTNREHDQIRSTPGPNNGSHVKTSTPLFNQGPNNRPSLNLDIRSTSPLPEQEKFYLCVTPPLSSNNLSALSDKRGNNLPGQIGYSLTVWGDGNLPNIPSILGSSPSFTKMRDALEQPNGHNPLNKLFLRVSHEIISDWKNVGRHLEIGESNISIIDQNYADVKEKAYSMLTKWQEFRGHDATKEILIKALEDCELKRVAEIVEEFDITPYVHDVTDLETDGVDDSSGLEIEMFD
ncbi:uncharacterized protein LOC127711251 [Mytilus californianus]|uniref:uncharacterized protein LOC127711251 n=1 Tax=Mytilus californianus TaxID=6549 RepID=UPI00224503B2|nr:uncharacterized protein LOC127711251 [Mytilus californianus]XP_052073204.1 uncharacterized protein LOC127711251 [Mytilus californianus]